MVQRRTTSAPVTLPCPRIGMQTNLVKAFISAARFRIPAEFMCFPRVMETPIPKRITANLARFIRSTISSSFLTVSAVRDTLSVHRLVLDESAQRRHDLEVLAGPYLEEDVRGLRADRSRDIHRTMVRPLVASARTRPSSERVPGEMARMAFCRIAAPEDHDISPVLDFAQRAGDLATQLGGDLGGAVSKRGVAVDHTSDHFSQRHGPTLRLACDVAQSIDQRHVGCVEKSAAASIASSTVAGFPSINASDRDAPLCGT